MADNYQVKMCEFVAVKPQVTNAISLLQDGLKEYKYGDEHKAAQKCKQALYFVLKNVEGLTRDITSYKVHTSESTESSLGWQEALRLAADYIKRARMMIKERQPKLALYTYYDAILVLYMGAGDVSRSKLQCYYSMLAKLLQKFAKLGGALQRSRLDDAAELQVVALVITEYVLGPASRESVRNRLATSRMYYEAAKMYERRILAAARKRNEVLMAASIANVKINIRQAKKYGADSCHAARHVFGMISKMTLSAYRLYINVQNDRYRVEKYTDENWDFNVIHETYTYLLEQLGVSR